MSTPPVPRPGKSRLARAALRLYPPAWRARYGAEVLALLDDTGGGMAAALGLAWRALPAWIWPPRQLHDRDARMRASLGTVLVAGAMLAGVCLVFAQLTQFQGFMAHGSAVVVGSYAIFDAAMAVCALAAAVGGLPLWLVMLRRARREHRARETAYLMLPVVAPAAYLATLATVARLLGGPDGVSPGVFLAVTLLGFGAAAAACAGPVLTMQRLRPRGPAVQLAVRAAAVATAAIVVAAGASATALTGLSLWAHGFAGYHSGAVLGGYLAVVAALAMTAAVSARRGARAARSR
ncbi:MAG TPA: hypothetical protein VNW50_05230 [Streptosporangiaceae bacterium]|nr:hypothetical protein [Streptosporangiaceae bacterium]